MSGTTEPGPGQRTSAGGPEPCGPRPRTTSSTAEACTSDPLRVESFWAPAALPAFAVVPAAVAHPIELWSEDPQCVEGAGHPQVDGVAPVQLRRADAGKIRIAGGLGAAARSRLPATAGAISSQIWQLNTVTIVMMNGELRMKS